MRKTFLADTRTDGDSGAPLVLARQDAHLWRVDLTATSERMQAFEQTLSADELQRADRFHYGMHRRRFVVGRGVLRALLGQYLDRAPTEILFAYGVHGKPALAAAPGEPPLFFNLSRSGDCTLIAITGAGEIGVDVEQRRAIPEWEEIAQRILALDRGAVPPSTLDEFFREWTRHEARVKAAGLGLCAQPSGEEQWTVHSLSLAGDMVAAIAFPAGVSRFSVWDWSDEAPTARPASAASRPAFHVIREKTARRPPS